MKGRLLMWVVVLILTASLLPVVPTAVAAPQVPLNFMVWTFAIDTINDNIKTFKQRYPNIDVRLTDYNWGQYPDTIVTNFVSGRNAPDVLYSSDHWLQQWAAAGWIVPLDDHFPQIKEMAKSFSQYAVEGMSYNGKIYGLPYYADPMAFFYNESILKKAGFSPIACGMTSRSASRRAPITSTLASGTAA